MSDAPAKEPALELHEMTPPSVAVVLTCADAKLVDKSVREIAAEGREGAAAPQESDVDGVHIVTFDPKVLSFFIQAISRRFSDLSWGRTALSNGARPPKRKDSGILNLLTR